MKTRLKILPKPVTIPQEPKFKHRFVVEFEDFDMESYVVESITKPVYHVGYWGDIKIEFVDPIGPSTSKILFKLIHPEPKEGFKIYIKSLDPTGVVVETWKVEVKRIKTINFGDLSYRYSGGEEDRKSVV